MKTRKSDMSGLDMNSRDRPGGLAINGIVFDIRENRVTRVGSGMAMLRDS